MASVAGATTYYVKASCTNNITTYNAAADTCTGGSARVYSSINNALNAGLLTAGDTLDIRAGTYAEAIYSFYGNLPPGGTDWGSGALTIQGHVGETITLTGDSGRCISINTPTTGNTYKYFIFKNIVCEGAVVGAGGGANGGTVHHIKWDSIVVQNVSGAPVSSGAFALGSDDGSGSDNWVINSRAENIATGVASTNQYHCYYVESANNTVEYSKCINLPNGFGIHNYGGNPHDNIFRYNYFDTIGQGNFVGEVGCAVLVSGDNNQFYGNLCIDAMNGVGATGTQYIYSNTFSNIGFSGCNCYAVFNIQNSVNTVIRNNIIYPYFGSLTDTTGATGQVIDHNVSTDPSFVNSATGDFSLSPTSAAISAGTSTIATGITLSCVGTCDAGVYEVPQLNSCSAAGTTLSLTFDNPRFPPITNLATTGLSLTVDGTSRSLSSPVLIGTNQVNVTFSGAAVTSTASSTGSTSVVMTDSANIGNSTSNVQKVLNWGSTACTVTPPAGASFAQTHFRFHDLPGTEAAPRCLSASGVCTSQEDVNYTVQKGGCFRLRLKMSCTGGDCAAGGFIARYSKNGGGYTVVPDTFGADNIKLYGTGANTEVPNQGTQTTELLTSGFATNVTGAVIRTSNAIPNVDLSQNSESELEYVMCIDSDETVGTTYDFRLYNQNGTALDTYSVTPRLTIATPRMKGHGLGV